MFFESSKQNVLCVNHQYAVLKSWEIKISRCSGHNKFFKTRGVKYRNSNAVKLKYKFFCSINILEDLFYSFDTLLNFTQIGSLEISIICLVIFPVLCLLCMTCSYCVSIKLTWISCIKLKFHLVNHQVDTIFYTRTILHKNHIRHLMCR